MSWLDLAIILILSCSLVVALHCWLIPSTLEATCSCVCLQYFSWGSLAFGMLFLKSWFDSFLSWWLKIPGSLAVSGYRFWCFRLALLVQASLWRIFAYVWWAWLVPDPIDWLLGVCQYYGEFDWVSVVSGYSLWWIFEWFMVNLTSFWSGQLASGQFACSLVSLVVFWCFRKFRFFWILSAF